MEITVSAWVFVSHSENTVGILLQLSPNGEREWDCAQRALTRTVSYVNAFVYNFNWIENFWPTNKMELMGVGAVAYNTYMRTAQQCLLFKFVVCLELLYYVM